MSPDFVDGFALGKKEGRAEVLRELRTLLGVDDVIDELRNEIWEATHGD